MDATTSAPSLAMPRVCCIRLGRVRGHRDAADEEAFLPLKAEGLEGVHVVDICAGDSHSAALTDDGRVFACGVFRVCL